jgi:hypothetical protein
MAASSPNPTSREIRVSASAPDLQSFLDSVKTLAALLSLALEQLQDAREEFVLNANEKQFGAFERSVSEVRFCSERLERQFNRIEYLVAKRLPLPDCCTKQAQVFPHSQARKS